MRLSLAWAVNAALPVAAACASQTPRPLLGVALVLCGGFVFNWADRMRSNLFPPKGRPKLVLETISASHFVEKVRWALDRTQVEYAEQQNVGVLRVLFAGQTVPTLHIAGVGALRESSAILRYLHGARHDLAPGVDLSFLETSPAIVELEKRLDRYGVNLQVFVYSHFIESPHVGRVWGFHDPRLPLWQRVLGRAILPFTRVFMRRAFSLHDAAHVSKSAAHVRSLLGDIEAKLAAQAARGLAPHDWSISEHAPADSYVNTSFAALSALWVLPRNYTDGAAPGYLSESLEAAAADPFVASSFVDEAAELQAKFPHCARFVSALYDAKRRCRKTERVFC